MIEITNFQNEAELITISILPRLKTWSIDSPESIMSNSSANVTLNLPESGYEAVVWVIPDDSGTTLFTDIRGLDMRVAILGVGSIGGVFLSSLSNADVDLLAISRGPTTQS